MTAVRAEIDLAAQSLGLRTAVWGQAFPRPPALLQPAPDRVNYRSTYGPTKSEIEATAVLIVSRANDRTAMLELAKYLGATGANSIKAALEGYAYTTCDGLVVSDVDVGEARQQGGTDYLAAVFHLLIWG